MADDNGGTDDEGGKKTEPTQEKPKMADVDWRTAAKNAGYELVPAADLNDLRQAQESLKTIRSAFPEDARGKEADWLKDVTGKVSQIPTLQEQLKSVEQLQKENETLKTQNGELAKGKKLSDMWGHITRVQQTRNVRVHDRFIDESKLVDFDLEKHDFSKPEGVQKFTDSVWKDILEPAYKEQTQIIEQVGGGSSRKQEKDGNDGGDTGKDDSDGDEPTPWSFGSQA